MNSPTRIREHVHSVMDPDGAVLLDVKRGKYFSLNGVAADIWNGLQGGLDVSRIQADIEHEYGISADQAREDVTRFMARLEKEELVDATR
jgi:hypothetical protein